MPVHFLASALSAITSGREIVKWLFGRIDKKDIEAAEKIIELQSILITLGDEVAKANAKHAEFQTEIIKLKNVRSYRYKLIRRNAYYEFAEPVKGFGQGPFCLYCTDSSGGVPVGVPVDDRGYFACAHCGTSGWLEGKKAINTMLDNAKRQQSEEIRRKKYPEYPV